MCFDQRRTSIKEKTGIVNEGGEGIYLGIPEPFRGSKVNTLRFIKERLKNKVVGCLNKFLTPVAKEVLLKAVAMAQSNYPMSCFLLPKMTCQQTESVMANFLWKNSKESKGMHWKSWEYFCKSEDWILGILKISIWHCLENMSGEYSLSRIP